MGKLLKIDHVSYTCLSPTGEIPILSDISFHVDEGEFIAILGPAGCGKSTLLSLIAGLLSPTSGLIYINDRVLNASGKNIGYITQRDRLQDWPDTLDTIPHSLNLQQNPFTGSYVQINELLNTYGLITFPDSLSTELPSGAKQRATLIRTLLLEPDIILLDEPFATLDDQTRLEVADDIREIIRKEKKTALLITYDIAEAVSIADRVILLTPRPGTIKQIIDIKLNRESLTPSALRDTAEFKAYYDQIWHTLSHNEE